MISFSCKPAYAALNKYAFRSNSTLSKLSQPPSCEFYLHSDFFKNSQRLFPYQYQHRLNNIILESKNVSSMQPHNTKYKCISVSHISAKIHQDYTKIPMEKIISQFSLNKQKYIKYAITLSSVAYMTSKMMLNHFNFRSKLANCEGFAAVPSTTGDDDEFARTSQEMFHGSDAIKKKKNRIRNISWIEWISNFFGHAFRAVQLLIIFSPAIITSPFMLLSSSDYLAHLWRRLLVISLEMGGPTWVKLAQWASTRADLFSRAFRDDISVLHDRVGREPKYLTQKTLNEAFGVPFSEVFEYVNFDKPIGAGCIAQVYRGKLLKDGKEVAIKVRRYGVAKQIERDVDLMIFGTKLMETIIPSFKWFNLNSAALMFAEFMESQLDLRREGRSLEVFRENFASSTRIRFPEPVAATETVLVETFCEGTRLNVFLDLIAKEERKQKRMLKKADNAGEEDMDDEVDEIDDEEITIYKMTRNISGSAHSILESLAQLRKDVAREGVHAFLQMVLVDNWVHSDLHSGNILIKTNPPLETVIKSAKEQDCPTCDNVDNMDDYQQAKQKEICRKQVFKNVVFEDFWIIDTGLVTTLTDKDMKNFLDLFKAVADGDGELAGRLMIDRSTPPKDPKTGWPEGCVDPEGFITGMKDIVSKVKLESFRLDKIQIGRVLEQVLHLVHRHRIMIDSSFTSMIVAIVVLEGVGRQLDPTMNIFKESLPVLAKADEK